MARSYSDRYGWHSLSRGIQRSDC